MSRQETPNAKKKEGEAADFDKERREELAVKASPLLPDRVPFGGRSCRHMALALMNLFVEFVGYYSRAKMEK